MGRYDGRVSASGSSSLNAGRANDLRLPGAIVALFEGCGFQPSTSWPLGDLSAPLDPPRARAVAGIARLASSSSPRDSRSRALVLAPSRLVLAFTTAESSLCRKALQPPRLDPGGHRLRARILHTSKGSHRPHYVWFHCRKPRLRCYCTYYLEPTTTRSTKKRNKQRVEGQAAAVDPAPIYKSYARSGIARLAA